VDDLFEPKVKVDRETNYESMPFRPRSIVATSDGARHRVLAFSSSGAERVIECIDEGPRAGGRRIASPRDLQLISGPPPKEAPVPPALCKPSIPGKRVVDEAGNATIVGGSPNIVVGDFVPEMFPAMQRGSEQIALEGGPYPGVETRIARGAKEHSMLAAGPNGNFAPALYRRTSRQNENGLAVFEFFDPGNPAPARAQPAAALARH